MRDGQNGSVKPLPTITIDALVRSVAIRRDTKHLLFLGAGASITSGMPSAASCIWEWKRDLFLTHNPGLERQFAELSLVSVRHRIQDWLDSQQRYPKLDSPDEYGFYIENCYPIVDDRRKYFATKVSDAKPFVGYQLLAELARKQIITNVWSTNFDSLSARAAAAANVSFIEVGIDCQHRLEATNSNNFVCVSLHGDYRYDRLKNTSEELQKQENQMHDALIRELHQCPTIVCGYSGRDESIMQMFEAAYEHEQKVTAMINNIVDIALAERDHATASMLNWFVDEQVEEEANSSEIAGKLKLIGESKDGLFMLDKELAIRVFVDRTQPAGGAQA